MSEDKTAVLKGCSFLIDRAVNTGVCCTVSDVKLGVFTVNEIPLENCKSMECTRQLTSCTVGVCGSYRRTKGLTLYGRWGDVRLQRVYSG